MPAAYAHHRFGSNCIETMPERLQKICLSHRDLFDFGVHGPDIFFYNEPLKHNPVNQWGQEMHRRTGREFFSHCREVYRENPEKAAMLSYTMGFLAHFTLDASCHGYINEHTNDPCFSHNLIESQYDAFLMRRDGLDPVSVNRADSLHPSGETAHVIAHFFDLTDEDVLKSLKGQRGTMKLLYSPRELKKALLRRLIRTLKFGGSFDDLFIDNELHPLCGETNEMIYELQAQALNRYPKLLKNFVRFLKDKEELDPYFDLDFESICRPAGEGE